MGWCSGTDVFDKIGYFILYSKMSDELKHDIMLVVADTLEDHDWDCQNDSEYWTHPIVVEVMKELHPNWDWDTVDED